MRREAAGERAAYGGLQIRNTFTTASTNAEGESVDDVALTLAGVSDGWAITPVTTTTFDSVAAGTTVKTTWRWWSPPPRTPGYYQMWIGNG